MKKNPKKGRFFLLSFIWAFRTFGTLNDENPKGQSKVFIVKLNFQEIQLFGYSAIDIRVKEGVSLQSQPKVRFREYFVYFPMRKKSLKNHPLKKCWEHWFHILIIPKSYQKISERINCSTKKPVT